MLQGFGGGCGIRTHVPVGKRFSRPPRYDHFDNPPNEVRRGLRSGSVAAGERIRFATFGVSRNIPPNEVRRGLRSGSVAAGERIRFATFGVSRNNPP